MLSALVIDDELLAREELSELLEETGDVDVVGHASNAIERVKKNQSAKARRGVSRHPNATSYWY